MKAAIVLSFVAAAMAAVINERTNGCNADNCARAVTGTRDGLLPITSRQADCSSFMRATVTPKATYVYPYSFYILYIHKQLLYANNCVAAPPPSPSLLTPR